MVAYRTSYISLSGIRAAASHMKPGAIYLGLGQPDFDTPAHVKAAAKQAIDEGCTGYSPNTGFIELIEAIIDYYRRYNVDARKENVLCTSGASEGLHLSLEALVNPGDEVIIPDPGFVAYAPLTHIAGGTPVGAQVVPEDDFRLTPETVAAQITTKTKALIVNSPANPTGAVQRSDDMQAFVELANDYDFYIISDEVYDRIIYDAEHISPASIDPERVIVVNAASKTYAMTGWRLGYTIAPIDLIEEMLKMHQYIQACAPSISQKAAYAALTGPSDSIDAMVREFRNRRDLVLKELNGIADCVVPQGAFYVFPRFHIRDTSVDLAAKFAQAGVIVVPGSTFGVHGEGYIRISYAASQENLRRALCIIREQLS